MEPLLTLADLDRALEESRVRQVVIFKHSLTCGTSAMAAEEMDQLDGDAIPDTTLYIVPIQQARQVSDAIEARLKIRHESPQVIVLRDGQVAWHGSHFQVMAARIRKVLATPAQV